MFKAMRVLAITVLINPISGGCQMKEPQIPFAPKKYICQRASEPLVIDGKMDGAWQAALWTDYFVDIEGDLKPRPEFDTRVKMLWDDEYFYFFAALDDPHVRATFTEHDSYIFHEDGDIEIFIDPDGDTHHYFELEENAFATYWDLSLNKPYRDGGKARDEFDFLGLRTQVHVDGVINDPSVEDQGWSAEIAIPWNSVIAPDHQAVAPAAGDQWRVNFSRVQWHLEIDAEANTYSRVGKEENWVWSPQGLIHMHYPEMWGFVQFSDTTAGSDPEPFVWSPVEDLKWALRQVYYSEHKYWEYTGKYTANYDDLDRRPSGVKGYQWPPTIELEGSGFVATVVDEASTHAVHIRNDSKVWVEELTLPAHVPSERGDVKERSKAGNDGSVSP